MPLVPLSQESEKATTVMQVKLGETLHGGSITPKPVDQESKALILLTEILGDDLGAFLDENGSVSALGEKIARILKDNELAEDQRKILERLYNL